MPEGEINFEAEFRGIMISFAATDRRTKKLREKFPAGLRDEIDRKIPLISDIGRYYGLTDLLDVQTAFELGDHISQRGNTDD